MWAQGKHGVEGEVEQYWMVTQLQEQPKLILKQEESFKKVPNQGKGMSLCIFHTNKQAAYRKGMWSWGSIFLKGQFPEKEMQGWAISSHNCRHPGDVSSPWRLLQQWTLLAFKILWRTIPHVVERRADLRRECLIVSEAYCMEDVVTVTLCELSNFIMESLLPKDIFFILQQRC